MTTPERAALRRLGGVATTTDTTETLPGLIGRYRSGAAVELALQVLDPSHPLREKVLTLLDVPPPVPPGTPHLTAREAAVVQWLLDRIDRFGIHCPIREAPEREAARMTGWGTRCDAGHQGCAPAGWQHVALARVKGYAWPPSGDPDPLTEPGQAHPFKPGGLLGPWPPCYPRFLHTWHHWDLP